MERKKAPSRTPRKGVSAEGHLPVFPFLLFFAAPLLLIPTLLLPPEGAQRSGDAFPLVFGWIVFAGAGFIAAASPGRKGRLADLAVLLLLIWAGLSWLHLKAAHTGNLLHAANGFWTFALMPLVYFALRAVPNRFRRAAETLLMAVIVGAALFESAVSLYDYFVTAPSVRAQFLENPEQLLRESGLNIEKGTPEYDLFVKRVLDSSEPIGTFGLTNTLAGLLAPVLVLLAALLLTGALSRGGGTSRRSARLSWITVAAVFLILGLTLILTKSRAGYLALLAGAAAVPFSVRGPRRAAIGSRIRGSEPGRKRKALLISGAVIAVGVMLAAAAFRMGFLDREVFSEAKKSLGYRLDYWTASSRMIADHPLFGIGPGNFQNTYPRYILPTASETIADPHNFAFEYAVLFGIPALGCFLLFLGSVLGALRKQIPYEEISGESEKPPFVPVLFLFAGGYLLYTVLNFLTSAPSRLPLLLGMAPVFLALAFPAALLGARLSRLPSPALAVAAGAALLNLSAAGGIGYPPAALMIWIPAAVILSRAEPPADEVKPSPARRLLVTAAWILLFALYLGTGFYPILTEKTLLPRLDGMPPGEAEIALTHAADGAGRRSIPIRWALCTMAMYDEGYLPSPERESAWRAAREELYRTAPENPSVRGEMADEEFTLYEATGNRLFLDAACASYEEAARLYPTNALYHAAWAMALHAAGETEKAQDEKAEALRLDALTPHEDRKIPEELKSLLTSIGENE